MDQSTDTRDLLGAQMLKLKGRMTLSPHQYLQGDLKFTKMG